MKHLSRLRPSPALVVALIALFVSLGGVSYGVATGYIDSREIRNNTVASGDIRNNDIRTKDLRNNEIRGIDIRNSTVQGRDIALATVTGQDVREATLSEVPTAARAARAGSSGSVDSLRVITTKVVAQGGAPVTLVQYGPLTVTGACPADMGGPRAEVRVQSSEAGSSADGEEASFGVLGAGAQTVAAVASTGPRAIESSPIVASGAAASLSGVVSLIADGAGGGSVPVPGARRGERRPGTDALDLDDHRQDHRPAAQLVVDELGHVVVQMVLQEVDLGDLLLGRAAQRGVHRVPKVGHEAVALVQEGHAPEHDLRGTTERPSCSETVATTMKIPSAESMRRSRRATSSMSPTSMPSTKIMPACSRSPKRAPRPSSSRGRPFSPVKIASSSIPTASASSPCSRSRLWSPCMGITY